MEKKGQVSIIVVVLMIVIVLVVILILWNVLNPLIREKGKEVEEKQEALGINLRVNEALFFVTGALRVSVERNAGMGELSSLKFVFYDEKGNSYAETRETDMKELETKTYSFSPLQDSGEIKSVSVLPVVGGGIGIESEAEKTQILEIPSGLVSWWRFDSGGEDFIDGNNCNGASIVADSERGNVGNFNGGISCGNSNLDINNKVAISFWINTSDNDGTIIKKGGNYEISLSEGKIDFSYTSGGSLISKISDSEVNDGKWHHVVVTRDWSGDNYLRVYIDGTGIPELILMSGDLPETNTENVLIGGFQGELDEVMFFNEALSSPEAEALYNNQKK